MDEKGLGKRLQEVRRAAGLTQQELCQKANLSYSTLAKIERGAIKSPSIFTIRNIAEALGISMDELLGLTATPALSHKKTSRSGVKFVYFDVNGCMVRFPQQGLNRLAQESGVPIDQIENVFWEYDDAVCRGDKTIIELNQALEAVLNHPVDWQVEYIKSVEPVPGIADLAAWVAENYHSGLLTNTMPGFINAMWEENLLPDAQFEVIVDSSVVGALKPESEIYEEAESQSGMQPSEILLIDDTKSNLVAAKKRGWNTIWFDYYRPEESITSIKQALQPAD